MRTHDYNANIFAAPRISEKIRCNSLASTQTGAASRHAHEMFGFACLLPTRADTNRIPNSHPRYEPKIGRKARRVFRSTDFVIPSSFVIRASSLRPGL